MSKKKWLILLATCLVLGVMIAALLVLAFGLGFLAGHRAAMADGSSLPVFSCDQTNSAHVGWRRTTLTSGNDVYVCDYEESALQLKNGDPRSAVGRMAWGNAKVCAIPGQPITAYITADQGSEMPAYVVFRHASQPPFDWRNTPFRSLNFTRPDPRRTYKQSSDPALIAEVIRTLRDGRSVDLPGFPAAAVTNLATIKMSSDQLPGLLFCPSVYVDPAGPIYLAESLMMDPPPGPPRLHARWVAASPALAAWMQAK